MTVRNAHASLLSVDKSNRKTRDLSEAKDDVDVHDDGGDITVGFNAGPGGPACDRSLPWDVGRAEGSAAEPHRIEPLQRVPRVPCPCPPGSESHRDRPCCRGISKPELMKEVN